MKFKVVLYPSEEGFSVSAPSLPGCWSQGTTEEEALKKHWRILPMPFVTI